MSVLEMYLLAAFHSLYLSLSLSSPHTRTNTLSFSLAHTLMLYLSLTHTHTHSMFSMFSISLSQVLLTVYYPLEVKRKWGAVEGQGKEVSQTCSMLLFYSPHIIGLKHVNIDILVFGVFPSYCFMWFIYFRFSQDSVFLTVYGNTLAGRKYRWEQYKIR